MVPLARYFLNTLRFPHFSRLGLLKMGLGIERRYRALEPFWASHLHNCREMQAAWVRQLGPSGGENRSLAVLGAGLLFDLNLQALTGSFDAIHLIDANPLVKRAWKRAQRKYPHCRITGEITEISGVLGTWRNAFAGALSARKTRAMEWPEALAALRTAQQLPDAANEPFPASSLPGALRFSAVLSLNIMSQIPIVWQDAVEALLCRSFSRRLVEEREAQWLEAIYPAARYLVEQHLQQTAQLAADDVLLLTDLQYAHYRWPAPLEAGFSVEPPFSASAAGGEHWQLNARFAGREPQGASCEVYPALYGVDLEQPETWNNFLPDFQPTESRTWLWHIEPAGAEQPDTGTINRVGAFALRRTAQPDQPSDITRGQPL